MDILVVDRGGDLTALLGRDGGWGGISVFGVSGGLDAARGRTTGIVSTSRGRYTPVLEFLSPSGGYVARQSINGVPTPICPRVTFGLVFSGEDRLSC
jgi:hypothetical protein